MERAPPGEEASQEQEAWGKPLCVSVLPPAKRGDYAPDKTTQKRVMFLTLKMVKEERQPWAVRGGGGGMDLENCQTIRSPQGFCGGKEGWGGGDFMRW